jgi:hypothetical protein
MIPAFTLAQISSGGCAAGGGGQTAPLFLGQRAPHPATSPARAEEQSA